MQMGLGMAAEGTRLSTIYESIVQPGLSVLGCVVLQGGRLQLPKAPLDCLGQKWNYLVFFNLEVAWFITLTPTCLLVALLSRAEVCEGRGWGKNFSSSVELPLEGQSRLGLQGKRRGTCLLKDNCLGVPSLGGSVA